MNNQDITIIGIGGGSASGKTTVVRKILRFFKYKSITKIDLDSYYKDFSALSPEQRNAINFDHPQAFDFGLLYQHIKLLKEGKNIEKPVYDYKTHLRQQETKTVSPSRLLILEGILIFADPKLREIMDLKIFVDAPSDIRLMRRIERDIKHRGRSIESIKQQYFDTVRPMHIEFIETTKQFVDIIIPNGGHNRKIMNMIIWGIKNLLK